MQGRMNIPTHGGGGGELSLNIFAQAAEPATKNGIWINTSATGSLPLIENFEYDGIEITHSDFHNASNGSIIYIPNPNIPDYFANGAAVAVGTDIYIFGGTTTNSYPKDKTSVYKYNTTTCKYTKMRDTPSSYYFQGGVAVVIGTDIYLFGSSYSTATAKYAYKYNTTTNAYTQLTYIPYYFSNGVGAVVGTDIYLFGGYAYSTYYKLAYKYDTTTNTYTQLANTPESFVDGAAVAVGTDIYIFGGYAASTWDRYRLVYKYDTLTNTYTQLANVMSFTGGAAVAVGTDIYLIWGGRESSSKVIGEADIYKYDINTDKYTKVSTAPSTLYQGSAAAVGTDIYLLGGNGNQKANYTATTLQLKNKYIYLFTLYEKYETQISNNLNIPVFYARICQNNALKAYPAYYGDGTQWNRLPD